MPPQLRVGVPGRRIPVMGGERGMIDVTELFRNGDWAAINEIVSEIKQSREEDNAYCEFGI